jgi:hypothetical protein
LTKKARRREGLFPPRRAKPSKPLGQRYGQHVLDATLEEIMPRIRPAPVDEPTKRADDQLLIGPLVAYLEALIDVAMAHSGALNTDEDPEQVLCEATGMSHLEYEAVLLWAEGVDWSSVARSQAVSPDEAAAAGKSGVRKLRRYVRT